MQQHTDMLHPFLSQDAIMGLLPILSISSAVKHAQSIRCVRSEHLALAGFCKLKSSC